MTYILLKYFKLGKKYSGNYIFDWQVVCDFAGKITNIVARWPGSAHDSRIFTESALKQRLEARANGSEWLLGDSG